MRVDDILYIEGMQNYVRIHTARQTVTTLQTLTALEGMLPADVFFRTHKSYIVNTDKIEEKNFLTMVFNFKKNKRLNLCMV